MNPQASYPPPPTPEGWDAVWDPNSQRYYFVQIATGVTQWDPPTGNPGSGGMAMPGTGGSMPMPGTGNDYNNNSPAPYGGSSMPAAHAPYGSSASPAAHAPYGSSASPAPSAASAGESNSYGGGGGPAYNNPTATSMPEGQHQQQGQPGQAGDERGLGTFVQSPMGGALAGSLIGFAAGKMLGKKNDHGSGHGHGHGHHGYQGGGYYPPPPPQQSGGFGSIGSTIGNLIGGGKHGHHGQHGHQGGGHGFW